MSSSAKVSDPGLIAELPSFREAIVKRPLTTVISDKIATLIASGILQVGDALPSERQLADALNVSRDAVRGGIQMLAARGILEISHGARTRVRSNEVGPVAVGFAMARAVNSYDIESVHAARLLVDRQVVADAARNIDDAGVAVLEALLEAQTETLDDPVRFLISDREFHVALYQASGNPLLADISTDLYAYMMQYRREAMASPGAIATSYADHVAIVAAVKARDPDAAAEAFAAHTGRIYTTTQPFLKGGA
ncbi:FadR/GntR family transcriptional regulator [Kaistia defluvii]|uniref:DNA-binding FadR family transcriptional regulator n=1 Tax=Kaistia defluvii TaxID=410841 RepID=A0ABV2R0N3_9HYPH